MRVLGGSLTRAPTSHECGLFTLTLTVRKFVFFQLYMYLVRRGFRFVGLIGFRVRVSALALTYSLPQALALALSPHALLGLSPIVAKEGFGGLAHASPYIA